MSPDITMADAITSLVVQKRAVGYKYAAEARVLARFAVFCHSEFPALARPGLGRGMAFGRPAARGHPGDPAGLGRAGPGVGPVASPPRRAGLCPAQRRATAARPLRPTRLHRPGTGRAVRTDGPLPVLC